MDILFLLIPVSLVLVFGIACALLWAVRSGQFDDLKGPAFRILADDDTTRSAHHRTRSDSSDPPEDGQTPG